MGLHNLSLIGAQAVFFLSLGQWVSGYYTPNSPGKQLEVVYEWSVLDFDYPRETDREHAIRKGDYVPRNVTAFEYNKYKDISFVTTPRIKYGSPSTLNTISHKKRHGAHLLKPFPNWEFNRLGNCHGLTSVYTTHVDDQGRLWVLDSGVVDVYLKVSDKFCPPKIVVFDLNAGNKIVATFVFPDKVIDCNSLFLRLAVDQRGPHLDDFWVYVSDIYGEHLVVLDVRHKNFYRITHPTFLKDPKHVEVNVAGVRTFYGLGIHSVVLGPLCNGDRKVYYHPLASVEECYVQASTLQNPAFATNERAFPDSFYCLTKKRESPAAIENAYDDVIFYYLLEQGAIKCWNTTLDPFGENTAVVTRNETTLQTVEALKVVGNELYGIASRLQLFFIDAQSSNEINFRVLRGNVDYLLNGTPCRECVKNKHESHHESKYEAKREYEAELEYEAEKEYEAELEYEAEKEYEAELEYEAEKEYEAELEYEAEKEYEAELEYGPERKYEAERKYKDGREYEHEQDYKIEREYEDEKEYEREQEYKAEREYEGRRRYDPARKYKDA